MCAVNGNGDWKTLKYIIDLRKYSVMPYGKGRALSLHVSRDHAMLLGDYTMELRLSTDGYDRN